MAVAFAAVAAILLGDFLFVVGRARNEWRTGEDLSAPTGLLIASLYALTAALLAMAIVWRPWRVDVPFVPAGVVGGLLVLGGLALALPGFVPFASVRQLYGVERGGLITDGVYRWSRNPQYTGMGIALLGAGVIARSGLVLLLAAAYWLAVRAWLVVEEEHLQAAFGARYARYRRTTARFIGLPGRG